MNFIIFKIFICLGFIFKGFLIVNCENNESNFVATDEWQVVEKGQRLPRGLHVRHNFQTGVTEAKFLDNSSGIEDTKSQSLALHQNSIIPDDKSSDSVIPIDEMKLKLDNLKKSRKETGINMSTDSEILMEIFQEFHKYDEFLNSGSLPPSNAENFLHLLNELEYLLHQIDNAQIFADNNGMSRIILPCLNLTNNDIKIEALKILGTAVQSNKKVQLKALDNNLVEKLLYLLTVADEITIKSKCMFALGALVRQFEQAQRVLINHNGLEIFGKILQNGHPSIQLRVMKLITDLAIERETIKYTDDEIIRQKQIEEYDKTEFEKYLLLNNYCNDLSNLLINTFGQDILTDSIIQQYEFIETIFDNMIALSSICKKYFRDNDNLLLNVINKISSHTSTDDTIIFENLNSQVLQLQKSFLNNSHDEL